jgi:hypothetical protein
MLARYVEPKITTLPFDRAREALAFGLTLPSNDPTAPGKRPSREVLALGMAKCALETGRWQKMWNWNFGNIKAGESYAGMFTCITLNEVIGGQVKWFAPDGPVIRLMGGSFTPTSAPRVAVPPGHPQTRMRAHANAFDGPDPRCGPRSRPAIPSASCAS